MNDTTFVVLTIGLLSILTVPSVMTEANASLQNNDTGPSNFGPCLGCVGAIEHINNAQSALQNGDIEGANNHLELAKDDIDIYVTPYINSKHLH